MQDKISKAKLTQHIQNFFIKTDKNPTALYNCFIVIQNEKESFNDRKKLRKIFDYSSSLVECSAIDKYVISEGILSKETVDRWKQQYREEYGIAQQKYRYSDMQSFVLLTEILKTSQEYASKEPLEWLFWLHAKYMCHTGKQKTVSFVNKWIQFVIKECQFEGLEINDKALDCREITSLTKKP